MNKKLTLLFISMALAACGSDDKKDPPKVEPQPSVVKSPQTVAVSNLGSVSVSGIITDAVKRTPLADMKVRMRVGGETYEVTTQNGDIGKGSYSFTRVPADSEYFIEVIDPKEVYAPYFYANKTPALRGNAVNSADEIISQDIGSAEMYEAKKTNISVRNINGKESVKGLTLYYDTKKIAEANSKKQVGITGYDVVAKEEDGIYSFLLPKNNQEYDIKVKRLIDNNSQEYKPYNAVLPADGLISRVRGGEDSSYYVVSTNPKEFTMFLHLVDEDGKPMDVGSTIPVARTFGGVTVYADKSSAHENEYVLKTNSANGFDYRLLPLDLNDDGFFDTQAVTIDTLVGGNKNPITVATFNEDREATFVVPVRKIQMNQAISSRILTDEDQFQVNAMAEVIIAFDRPVELLHGLKMTYSTFEKEEKRIPVLNPALVYKEDQKTQTTTKEGAASVSLNQDEAYSYNNDSGASVTLSLADSKAETVSPYEYGYEIKTFTTDIAESSYQLLSNNTLLKITLDPKTLVAHSTYTFEFAVQGLLQNSTRAYLKHNIRANSNATIASVDDLTVDNFDFIDTPQQDLTNAATTKYWAGVKSYGDTFALLPGATDANDTGKATYIRYLSYPGFRTDQIDALPASRVYLVSPAQLNGTVRIKSQTRKYLEAGKVLTEVSSDIGKYFGLDFKQNGSVIAGSALADFNLVNNIKSVSKYLVSSPNNQFVDEANLQSVLGSVVADTVDEQVNAESVVTSGANISAKGNGVYYIYPIPVEPAQSGIISAVELDLDVEVNGARIKGSRTFSVQ